MATKAEAQLKKILDDLKNKIKKTFSAREMQKIAQFVIEEIKDRSRKGYGVSDDGGTQERFKPLSEEYVKRRKKIKLSSFTTPRKSNITRSGRLLSSLRYTTRDGRALIKPTGNSREGTPNYDIAGYLAEQGRPFMHLSKTQLNRLVKFIESQIIDLK